MLEQCEDEQERVRQMQKLRFMINRPNAPALHQIEQDDPCYARLLKRITVS